MTKDGQTARVRKRRPPPLLEREYVRLDRAPTIELVRGEALAELRKLPDGYFQQVVTSPPFWGLRDYDTAEWVGGDSACKHRVRDERTDEQVRTSTLQGGKQTAGHRQEGFRGHCKKCGAIRVDHQIGLETTFSSYLQKIVEVFREVRRVLADDGTLWLEIGDAYDAGTGKKRDASSTADHGYWATPNVAGKRIDAGLGAKQLLGMPWRVAFALQEDGWILRCDNIWNKTNAQPESCRDRPSRSHTYLFLFAKKKRYYYDMGAIIEPASPNTHARCSQDVANQRGSDRMNNGVRRTAPMKAVGHRVAGVNPKAAKIPDGWNTDGGSHETLTHRVGERSTRPRQNASFSEAVVETVMVRNKRSVWNIPTEPSKRKHYAMFATKLVEPCILAGSRPGDRVGDPFCGTGTVGYVAKMHGRDFWGCDLSESYLQEGRRRIALAHPPLLVTTRKEGHGQDGEVEKEEDLDRRMDQKRVAPHGREAHRSSDLWPVGD